MKFFHISDLHIGKQLCGYSLRESQERMLGQIISRAESERPDALLICGDIYDRPVPSAEACTIFDQFLTEISGRCPDTEILIIAGNHDSPERLSYGASFLRRHRIRIAALPPQSGEQYLEKAVLNDEWGPVNFYLFPFIRPGHVRHLAGDRENLSYTEAFRAVLDRESIDTSQRNVILAHQFFTWEGEEPGLCDSETAVITAGGLDRIDASVLSPFDYAALGHLHGPQKVGRNIFRYSGSPYKYSVSEEHHRKSITVVDMGKKNSELLIRSAELSCIPQVRSVRGDLADIRERAAAEIRETGGGRIRDYVSITLTDKTEAFDFREQLEELFEHVLEIHIDNERTRQRLSEEAVREEIPDPLAAFRHFYEAVRRCPMTEEQEAIMRRIVESAQEEGPV